MKQFIYFILAAITVILAGCSEVDYLLYSDISRVQLADTTAISYTFVYEPASVIRDTVYIRVNTIGETANYDREIKLIQISEYDYTYVRDEQTGETTDTIITERPNKAIPGVHYLNLDDPSLKNRMVIEANAVTAQIPIVLLRDATMREDTYRLRLQIAPSADFELGELSAIERTIVISDHLERFYSWRADNSTAAAYTTFGKYSVNKHQFMIDILKVKIDEEWYQSVVSLGAITHYRNYFKAALETFNNNPENIANGKAPLHETNDPNSPLVVFP